MAYKQTKSMIAGTDSAKKARAKVGAPNMKDGYYEQSFEKKGAPMQQDNKRTMTSNMKDRDNEARQKRIDAIDAKIEALEEDRFKGKITQEQYDKAMETLRVQEKAVKKPL